VHSEVLKYEANGLNLESVLYFDETKTGKRPAVLLFPEGFGLSPHAKEKAQRLAELGYVVLASLLSCLCTGPSKTRRSGLME
jgi:dienelactone hydrolase